MRSRSYLFLAIVLGLAGLSGWLYSANKARLGLDVTGGVQLTYRMKLEELTDDQRKTLDMDLMQRILENRIQGGLGVTDGTVQRKGTDQWIIELPGFTNIQEAESLLQSTAKLQYFWARTVSTRSAQRRYEITQDRVEFNGSPGEVFAIRATGKKIEPGMPEYKEMIASWGKPILEGAELASAQPQQTGMGKYIPQLNFSPEGAKKMERWCYQQANRGENLAAVLDGVVLNIAPLKDGAVISTSGVIEGDFEPGYVPKLCALLNAGALPVSLDKLYSAQVDPTIGRHALDQIIFAGMIAFGFIAFFLLVYYVFPGLVALIALALYVLFTLTALKLLGATFSLAAIAGFILSVGMAVDANILVFERTKEELKAGKTLQASIDLGFRRALPAIFDSNACTILTSFVLMAMGTGPVKGFATTLIIGVAISLFTAITVTRLLLNFLVGSGLGSNPKWYGLSRQWFGEHLEAGAHHKPLQIVGRRKLFFTISVLTIIPGAIALGLGGIKPNVEFSGGYLVRFKLSDTSKTIQQVTETLESNGIKGSNVRFSSDGENRYVEVTAPGQSVSGTSEDSKAAFAPKAGFTAADIVEFNEVTPVIQAETVRNAILGVVYSAILIVTYLAIRFGFAMGGFAIGLRFSFAAIGAMIHDILVVLGLAAILGMWQGWEISSLFITAMLTMIGFSTHDTIVIFDRIRENLRRHLPGEEIGNLIDKSITQSIARSINTSFTVIVTLVFLIWFGSATNELRFFNTVMLFGIISGTYSSIWNASPILYVIDKWIERRKGHQATLLGIAAHELARAKVTAQDQDRRSRAEASEAQYGTIKRRSQQRPGERRIDE